MSLSVEVRPGLQLAVDDRGQGPAVVLMHGLAGFRELWSEFAQALTDTGWRAIAYDHRGHGESSDPPPPWTIADLADDLGVLLDALGIERACLIGHSMGGRTMFQFAVAHPDRVWAIVPVGAHSQAPTGVYREVLLGVRDATRSGGLDAFRREFEIAGEIPERVGFDADFAHSFERAFALNRAAMLVAALDAILIMPTLTGQLATLAVPALAIVGERDTPFRNLADVYARTMPRCQTVVVPDSHHYPMIDRPSEFAEAVLPFLRRESPPHAVYV